MMKFTPLFALALFAVSCTPDLPPLPKTTQATTAPAAPATAPVTTTTTTTTGSTTPSTAPEAKPSTSTASTMPGAPQAGDNPRRIHQLRELEHGDVVAGRQKIDAWLMDDESKQQEGMMFLTDKDVKDNQGMLFVFDSPKPQSFWMENTLIPLDIIYIDAKGKVLNIAHGKPKDETPLPSTGSAQYVLELKSGMASKFNIGPGTVVTIPSNAKYKGEPQAQPGGVNIQPQGQ